MFPEVRNHRFVNAYMLDRLIIQNALFVNSIKNNGCMLANSSELLIVLLSARCKYCLLSRNLVLVIIAKTARLWRSSHLSQDISCIGSPAHPLAKRIMRKALSFSTVTINIWLPFKWA